MRYLFPNFLTNELEYKICKNYWEVKIEYLLHKHKIKNYKEYLQSTYANGKEQLNGNPIINLYVISKNKALRIIQEEPETDKVEVSAWTNKFQNDDLNMTELVISLELTPEAEQIAFDLIKKWLINDYSDSVMGKYVDYVYESIKLKQRDNFEQEIYA